MSEDISLNVTMFLQHKTDFAAKWTITSSTPQFHTRQSGLGAPRLYGQNHITPPQGRRTRHEIAPTMESLGGKTWL